MMDDVTEPVKVCPLRLGYSCRREECAWWVPIHGSCAVCYIAEVAVQIRTIRQILVELIEIRGLLELPPRK